MVEFAIACTVFFILVFGAIQFSRAVWQFNVVANAAKAAARWTIVRGGSAGQTAVADTTIHNYIVTQMYGYPETDSITWLPTTKARGDTVKIVVRSSYTIGVPRLFTAYTVSMRSAAKMIIAR
jgi:Flp pilus assembly protein TadG